MKYHNSISNQIDHILYGAVGVTLCGAMLSVLTLSSAHATSGTASDTKTSNASVTVSATCSMTANVETAHTATLPNGIWSGSQDYYPNGIGKTNIATFCNDASGYSIYAVGFTGDSMTGSNTVLHNNQLGTTYDIATGTAKSGANSNWAMKVTKVTGSGTWQPENLTIQNGFDNENYHEVPANYTEVARYSTATDATLGSQIETTYSAYVSSSQPAGTYEGKVKYTLVHPGGSDAPTPDTMQNVAKWQNSLMVGEEVTVTDNRDGQEYTVARLCTNYDGNNCTSSQIWMTQNLNFQIGGNDQNGNPIIMTSDNTDLNNAYEPDGTTLKADYSVGENNLITWAPTVANTTPPNETENTSLTGSPVLISDFAYHASDDNSAPDWRNQRYYPYQAEGTFNGVEQYQWPGSLSDSHGSYDDCIAVAANTSTACAHYNIGNYYNFTAANAMSNSTNYNTQYIAMDNSICPKGWRMPKGITENNGSTIASEYNQLFNAQGVTANTDLVGDNPINYTANGYDRLLTTGSHGDPLYFIRSGEVTDHALLRSSYLGTYLSSTIRNHNYSYNMNFYPATIYPAQVGGRNNGRSVRCVAR